MTKRHLPDCIHIFRTYLDCTAAARHGAVGDRNIFTGTEFSIFPAILETNAIIAAFNITITNANVLAMVHIYAVAIAHLDTVQYCNSRDYHIVATGQMYGPISGVANMNIMNADIISADNG